MDALLRRVVADEVGSEVPSGFVRPPPTQNIGLSPLSLDSVGISFLPTCSTPLLLWRMRLLFSLPLI